MNPIAQKMPKSLVFEEKPTHETMADTKPSAMPRRDERKSCRCTVPEARRSCELKVGADVLPASLANESKTGFAVLIDRLGGLKRGDKVKLHTDKGWFTVRIVYIKEVTQPEYIDLKSDSWFRVGMKKARGSLLF